MLRLRAVFQQSVVPLLAAGCLAVAHVPSASAQTTSAVSGRVTSELTGSAVLPAWVSVVDALGLELGSASVDASGNYQISGLPPGAHYVVTSNDLGYLDELFDDVVCEPFCLPSAGRAVTLLPGETTPGIDFRLLPGLTIFGTISEAGTGQPLADVAVDIFSAGPDARVWSDASGNYRVTALIPRNYYLRTDNDLGYLDKLFEDIACEPSCNPFNGTAVNGDYGDERRADFVLKRGGVVSGRVRDQATGAPIANVKVQILDANGVMVKTGFTDSQGRYKIIGLPTGSYRARTTNSFGYIDELYDDVTCAGGCNVGSGKDIAVTAGATTENINFALVRGAEITGRVTSKGTAVGGATVMAYRESDLRVFSAKANASGYYAIRGLTTGVYYVVTSNTAGYLDEVYDDLACYSMPCNLRDGTLVEANQGRTTEGINFDLLLLGSISGRVIRSTTETALAGIRVDVFGLGGILAGSASTDQSGNYVVRGLSTGTYYARTANDQGFIDQLFQGTDCLGCNTSLGTPITVFEQRNTPNVRFALRPGGGLSGTVKDSATLAPLADLRVELFIATGAKVRESTTGPGGDYEFDGLFAGNYYVTVEGSSLGFANELYNDVPCTPSCTVTSGTPVPVVEGDFATGIDFLLDRLGSISGVVRDEKTGLGIKSMPLKIVNAAGEVAATTSTNTNGSWKVLNLRAGTYFAFTNSGGGAYIDEVFDNIACQPTCTALAGTPIVVGPGEAVAGIDFDLAQPVVPPTCATNVSKVVEVSRGIIRYRPERERYEQYVEIRSLSDNPIQAPIRLVLDDLSENATLLNASGQTACSSPVGSPFIIVETDSFLYYDDTAVVVLHFGNPSGQAITYKTRVLAGKNQP